MLGIIGAMDEEVARIKEQLTEVQVETRAAMDFYRGKLGGKETVVVRSGIGKVNAAICTQILADVYQVSGVVNTGIAGSLKAEIDIGDIVLSSDALQHDMDATGFGYAPGQVPRVDTLSFPADKGLIQLAEACCREVNPDIHTFVGRVVSGDQFISDKEKEGVAGKDIFRILYGDGGGSDRPGLLSEWDPISHCPGNLRQGGRQRLSRLLGL